ncbi:MAG: hypothetical protein AABO41_20495 [Acidobacteriota bacterium]
MQSVVTAGPAGDLDREERRSQASWVRALPWFALFFPSALYAVHFFLGGGLNHRILDSWAYLQISEGQQVAVPFNTRILSSSVAALMSAATGLSASTVFDLLTPASLLGSLFLLRKIIGRRGGTDEWQAAVLLVFGCSLAVTFGYTPVLVDPILLLFVCLTIAALDAGHLVVALVLVCAATLTKEYGLVLGVVWAFHAYRRGFLKFAFLGLIPPAVTLLILVITRQSDSGPGLPSWNAFAFHMMFEYQLSVFRLRGITDYGKLIYLWSWCAVWPAFFIALCTLFYSRMRRVKLSVDQASFAIVLATLPVLLLGDWVRSLIVTVPFVCIVATAHALARDRWFVFLLAVGGLSTALARPFHSGTPSPSLLTLMMTIVSVASSLAIGMILVRYVNSSGAKELNSGLRRTADEVAIQ